MTQIWHNPRCSKSRHTLALVQDQGIAPQVRLYLEDAPSEAEIKEVLNLFGFDRAIDLVRTGEKLFKELGLSKTDDHETLIAAMVAHPKLIERPIVINNGVAKLGRPPEQVLDIL